MANTMRAMSEGMPDAVSKWLNLAAVGLGLELRKIIKSQGNIWTGTYFTSLRYRLVKGTGSMPRLEFGHLVPVGENADRLPIYWKVLEVGAKPNPILSASPRLGGGIFESVGRSPGRSGRVQDIRQSMAARGVSLGQTTSADLKSEGMPGSLLAWSFAKFGTSEVARNIVLANRSGLGGIHAHPILSHLFIFSGEDLMVTGLTVRGVAIVEKAKAEALKDFQRMVFSIKKTHFRRRGKSVIQEIVRTERGPRFGRVISIE